jgi:predicted O-methyltransferase YrrM
MNNNIRLVKHYFSWYLKAKNLHGIHSPFIYRFNDLCINNDERLPEFIPIEELREELLKDNTPLTYTDPGAGNRIASKQVKTISTVTRNSLQKSRHCRLLYRIARYFNSQNILELGTSLGITTAYLSKACPLATIHTIEGALPIALMAEENFNRLKCSNIITHQGLFNEILPKILIDNQSFDLVFIDGDHKGESLLKYFNDIIKHIPPHGVIIIDDIRWSDSMWHAWQFLSQHPDIRVTVDLLTMGVVFVNPSLSKEHFIIKF